MTPFASLVAESGHAQSESIIRLSSCESLPSDVSPGVTAVAVSALVMAEQHSVQLETCDQELSLTKAYQGDLSELLVESLKNLARAQNADGGWGPQRGATSTVADTLSVFAAFQLSGIPNCNGDIGARTKDFIAKRGGLDKLTVPRETSSVDEVGQLAHLALANRIPWRRVPILPLDQHLVVKGQLGIGSLGRNEASDRALLLSAGLAMHRCEPTRNPWRRRGRDRAIPRVLVELSTLQSSDGSFGGIVQRTAYVVLFLAGARQAGHVVVRRGVEFLFEAVAQNSMWPDFHHGPSLRRSAK